jgi:urea carboxylase
VFSKVLVANRGEVAVRIITTLRNMGLTSVAVYSDADTATLPVRLADEAIRLGPPQPAASYLDGAAIIAAALATGAEAIHPGYGFLAEQADFAQQVEAAGLVFVGPTPGQLRAFGTKHEARLLAEAADVPLLGASPVLEDLDTALSAAADLGYPVVIKATAGGGGIGMRICTTPDDVITGFEAARRQAAAAFGDARVYLERYLTGARHIEVQIIGDGTGQVVVLGDRDCSTQRRHQKVVEESPAPGLPDHLRQRLHGAAQRLGESVNYRSAGTVEFLVDVATDTATPDTATPDTATPDTAAPDTAAPDTIAFLEVNARLQVEHPVTEAIFGVDIVEWMLRIAAGEPLMTSRTPTGHAVEVRLCAENPWRDHQPSAGTVTAVEWPAGVRVDTWVEAGSEVTAHYDSLLAKVIAYGETRHEAIDRLATALDQTRIEGLTTNVELVRAVVADADFRAGRVSTSLLNHIRPAGKVVEVVTGGTLTTVQDYPGRLGLWSVGVPPSGPMDDLSFRLGNRAVGNPEGAPGLELTANGPRLVFHSQATICLTGAPCQADIDGVSVAAWQPIPVGDGQTLTIGAIGPPGVRAYLLIRGGIEVSPVLDSRATFTLGGFGGHAGRALRPGDMLHLGSEADCGEAQPTPADERPELVNQWHLSVLEGPHGDGEFLTAEDLDLLYGTDWRVHHNSARTGVRLIGPAPTWARADGGDAGLHPSNIHDTAYAVGAVDFTGDMPILLGPDGPSLGGFVCPAVVTVGDRWKLGQLRPDDTIRLQPLSLPEADALRARPGRAQRRPHREPDPAGGLLDHREADGRRPDVRWRRSGEDYLLIEYGPMVLDLALRFRVAALQQWIDGAGLEGLIDCTPGIRSLQLHFDPDRLRPDALLAALQAAEDELPDAEHAEVESRIVRLPLSWDDPATRQAIDRYMSTVRADAPWCPWNIEFIRRINGLASVEDVHRVVFDASYLVLGLGDVYLGAPVATPMDPRHRLVTTKYNPARTWTPENAVGIGGAYLCVYGMEGPGGYQFVGRTVPVWNRFRRTADFTKPWLLRFFDQLRFFEVSPAELLDWRRDVLTGDRALTIEPTTLRLADHVRFCAEHADEISAFRDRQQAAFNDERARWALADANRADTESFAEPPPVEALPDGATLVEAGFLASVWKVVVEPGQRVSAGDPLVVLEAMKMETTISAPTGGQVVRVMAAPGQDVTPGQPLVALLP